MAMADVIGLNYRDDVHGRAMDEEVSVMVSK